MTWVDFIFFFYMFLGLYMSSLFFFIYFMNKGKLFDYPKGKPEPVSIVIPCYNEADSIGKAIESMLELNYPKNMIEVIVVDDLSKDGSVDVIKKYTKKYKNVKLIVHKKNSGRAAGPKNTGIEAAKYDYVVVADADSRPEKDALIKMIGFLQNEKDAGAVTCSVLVDKPKTFMQKMQEIEYLTIGFNRKMLDYVDSVYVTPGPFALYKKSVLYEIGLFDMKNMTEDIEIVWKMIKQGYNARMCLDAKVYTNAPSKFRQWWRQRVRWNIGGTQCIIKYKNHIFKKGMLGAFIIPFFSFSLFIGLLGLGLFLYLFLRGMMVSYLSTKYAVHAQTAIFRFDELSFTPSILNYFGFVLLILGLAFTFLVLYVMKARPFKDIKVFNILFYAIFYLTVYPVILVASLFKLITGKYSW